MADWYIVDGKLPFLYEFPVRPTGIEEFPASMWKIKDGELPFKQDFPQLIGITDTPLSIWRIVNGSLPYKRDFAPMYPINDIPYGIWGIKNDGTLPYKRDFPLMYPYEHIDPPVPPEPTPTPQQTIKSLDIEMRINPPPEIIFNLRYPVYDDTTSDENMIPVNAGYYRPNELYAMTDSKLRTENYTMRDTLMTDINISWRYSLQLSEKPVLLFTTDGRDPLTHGRTVFLKQEGDFWINDYDNSANLFPTLCGFALPINIRAALIDANRHDLVLTQASAVFTRESVATVPQQSTYLRTYCQALLADADADSRYSKSDDLHGYITLNEQNEILDYYDLIPGLEDGDN